MNWTRQTKADAQRSLAARVRAESFKAQRDELCKALEPSPEVTGANKAFAEAQRTFFACTTRNNQPLWQERAFVNDVGFYLDPLDAPPNEVVRLMHLFNSIDDPFSREKPLPTNDPMDNASLLEFAVAQRDLKDFDAAALESQLASAPYNEYARVISNEQVATLRATQRIYEAAIAKLASDADYVAILVEAPKKGYADWEELRKQWNKELERSNAFETKLGQASRKVLKGCTGELRGDVGKLLKSYKERDFKSVIARAATDPIANLLMSRLAVCTGYEKVGGLPGALDDIVRGGRNLRGPRSMAYYAVLDALAAALQDRPKMVFALQHFHWRTSSLAQLYRSEFQYSGSVPSDPERTDAKGLVASTKRVSGGIEITFMHRSYTYPEADCVDDRFHPLKIEANGTITYAQKCKYTGKMITVDTTPRPIVVSPELSTNVQPGLYVVGQDFGERAVVHFTKASPVAKTITTFYGFAL
jgi:hypothetical protein